MKWTRTIYKDILQIVVPGAMGIENNAECAMKSANFADDEPHTRLLSDTSYERGKAVKHTRKHAWMILSHLLVSIASPLFLLWGSQFFVSNPSLSSTWRSSNSKSHNSTLLPGANFYYCGNDVETAKASGCVYDILDNHWVPSRCIDQAAIEEYQSDDTWHGYRDADHTQLLGIEEMGETPVYYTNRRDHIVHCAMLWRKQFRAFMERRNVFDSIIIDEEHTVHCSQYLMDMTTHGPDFRQTPIEVHVGFAGCHVKE